MKQYARIQFNSRQNMTITSWRLSSCEDPLLFEIPADTSQPKGDAIQAAHNFFGDLAQCVWAASPSLPWRHSPAPGFPRLGTPCQSARPRWPQYGTCGPRWPPEAPMWAILRSSAPSVQSGPPLLDGWGLFKPLETQISWHDIFNVVWLSSTTAPMFNHRPEDPSWVESRALTRKQCRLERSNRITLNWITIPTEKDSLLLRAALSRVQVHVLENCSIWIVS